MPEWEDIPVPAGSFIGWGLRKGQHVTGRVVDYTIDGGTDYAGGRCPLLALELTEPCASFNKEGDRSDFNAGDIIQITAGQMKLKAGIRAADPSPGDLIRIELVNVEKTKAGNTLKDFAIKIARGTGVNTKAAVSANNSDEPPF